MGLLLELWSYLEFRIFGIKKNQQMDTFALGRNHVENILISTEERTALSRIPTVSLPLT
jgi:hypothetical protein